MRYVDEGKPIRLKEPFLLTVKMQIKNAHEYHARFAAL